MLYDVKFNAELDDKVYPPAIAITARVSHDRLRVERMLLKYALIFPHTTLRYVESFSPAAGDRDKKTRLNIDYHSFQLVNEQVKNSDPVRITAEMVLQSSGGAKLAQHQVTIEVNNKEWILAQNEDSKPGPETAGGLPPEHESAFLIEEMASMLRGEIAKVKEETADDPILQLQKKAFLGQVYAIKDYFLEQPEMKQLKSFEPLLDVLSRMSIDHNWAIAAGLLSAFEGFMKQWLVKHGIEIGELMKNDFDELTSKIEKTLKAEKIAYSAKKFTDLAGNRRLRNRVIHEMYVPSYQEMLEIQHDCNVFVVYLNSLLK